MRRILVFISICSLLTVIDCLTIDPISCAHPSPDYPKYTLQSMQDAIGEAFFMADLVVESMTSAENNATTAESQRTIATIETMLATRPGSTLWSRAKCAFATTPQHRIQSLTHHLAFYQAVGATRSPNNPNPTIYCNEDEMYRANPNLQSECFTSATESVRGYAFGNEAIILCSSIWEDSGVPRRVTLEDWRTHNWNGFHIDQLQSVSASVLHELLRTQSVTTRYYGNLRSMEGNLACTLFTTKDPSIPLSGYSLY